MDRHCFFGAKVGGLLQLHVHICRPCLLCPLAMVDKTTGSRSGARERRLQKVYEERKRREHAKSKYPQWARVLEDACKLDKELREVVGDSMGNAEEMKNRVEERILRKGRDFLNSSSGSAVPMKVSFREFNAIDAYIWLELYKPPSQKDIEVIGGVFRSWYLLGRLGAFNGLNLQYLPLVEYAYNNTVHSSTGKAPFEIVEGGKKVPPILHTKDKIFEADKYVQDMDEMYKKVKVALEKTQAKQKKAADRHCREVAFSLGDWVLLRFEKARLKKMKGKERLFPKLNMRYYGPFQVCDIISDVAYRLKLPESWKIHNAFHVSLLRPYVGDVPEDMPAEDQPEVEELDEILVPEQILAHKEEK
ncbi:hypothetical protein L7F22_014527 [Adiantum nelumboides]|nr:hypothetical protein [Adiantum nelumboides]